MFYVPADSNECVNIQIFDVTVSTSVGKLKELTSSNYSTSITVREGDCVEM